MKKQSLGQLCEWLLMIAIIGVVFLLGFLRIHQQHIELFFPLCFLVILILLSIYRVVLNKFES